jgi:hypothetical protein
MSWQRCQQGHASREEPDSMYLKIEESDLAGFSDFRMSR